QCPRSSAIGRMINNAAFADDGRMMPRAVAKPEEWRTGGSFVMLRAVVERIDRVERHSAIGCRADIADGKPVVKKKSAMEAIGKRYCRCIARRRAGRKRPVEACVRCFEDSCK